MRIIKPTLIALLGLLSSGSLAFGESVRVWQDALQIPTYALGAEDPNPPFSLGGSARIYPYTMLDDLTDRCEPKSYHAVYLENEFLKVTVLPELGGHLYSLYDKVNRREVLYRNHVLKYGLVALRGAWLAGGMEFNFPNGHTVVTVSPVAFTTRQNPDGSASIVVGDVDLVTEMYWEVTLILHPGQARLEQHVTLFNPTALPNLYWYWANTAVPATDDMRFIYPMREANPHEHGVLWSFPLHDGVDYSWYKNIRQPTSLFARDVHRNFFGAYYPQSDHGVVHVADFCQVVGKKTWTWGVADDGLIWTDLLTDHDGPYNEIQAGRFETQLTSEFMPPRRVESFTEFWYPLQGLDGGFVEATPRLALNVTFGLAVNAAQVNFALFPTERIGGVRLHVSLGKQLLRDVGPLVLDPMKTFKISLPVEDLEAAKSRIEITAVGADGATLLRWSAADPVDGNPDFTPVAGTQAPPPKFAEAMSVEELFLSGVEAEKSGNERQAEATYHAVLKRDAGYVPALVKMAGSAVRAGDFRSAEGYLATALARDDRNPETLYAAGVVYRAAHRWSRAEDMFWADLRFGGDPSSAYAQLGEIALTLKHYDQAVPLLREALGRNASDGMAGVDLALALRLAGRAAEAEKALALVIEQMPLLPYVRAEHWIAQSKAGQKTPAVPADDWTHPFPSTSEVLLQVAAWYRTLNDLDDSNTVLQFALKHLPAASVSPLVYYYLAVNAQEAGNNSRADDFARQGQAASYDRVFPNRLADAEVLDAVTRDHPLDAHAAYFLGNYLFAHGRYEDAAKSWTAALGQGFDYGVLMRNLGLYAWRIKNDLPDAAGFYEKAIKLNPDDYRLYKDLDDIYFRMGASGRREKLIAEAPAGVRGHDSVMLRRALLMIQEQQFDGALDLLLNHRFKPWEGGLEIHEMYVLANCAKGRHALAQHQPEAAEAAFRKALEYPHNLGSGKPDKPHNAEVWFWLGEALQAQSKLDAAREAWQQAVRQAGGAPLGTLYRGLAQRRLGEDAMSDKELASLAHVKLGDKASAEVLYAAGLLDMYEQRDPQGVAKLANALEADPDYWQARVALEFAKQ